MTEKLPVDDVGADILPFPGRCVHVNDLDVWFRDTHVLKRINVSIRPHAVTCIFGPSGSGKSTLLRCLNRMNDDVDAFRHTGRIRYGERDIYSPDTVLHELRREVGIIFQKPCVFPKSILDNTIFGVRHLDQFSRGELLAVAEQRLKEVALWGEVSHRLGEPAATLSIGQQQRLCIARTLALKPRVLLMDEPTASLDHQSTQAIEALILTLKRELTIVFVTHDMDQARRIADDAVFMCDGEIIECGNHDVVFNRSRSTRTRDYLTTRDCHC